jgi:hypothetical protein
VKKGISNRSKVFGIRPLHMLGIAAMACGLLPARASATVIFSDDFNAYTAGNLVGQGGWTQLGASSTTPIQVTAGKEVSLSVSGSSNQDAQKAMTSISGADGTVVVYDFDLNVEVADPDSGGDFFFAISPSVGTSTYLGRIYAMQGSAGTDPSKFTLGGGSSGGTQGTTELNVGTLYHITAIYTFQSGDDSFEINVDGNSYITSTVSTAGTSLSAVTLRQGGSNAPKLTMDNIVITDAIPEPTSLAFLGLGGLGLLSRRRK